MERKLFFAAFVFAASLCSAPALDFPDYNFAIDLPIGWEVTPISGLTTAGIPDTISANATVVLATSPDFAQSVIVIATGDLNAATSADLPGLRNIVTSMGGTVTSEKPVAVNGTPFYEIVAREPTTGQVSVSRCGPSCMIIGATLPNVANTVVLKSLNSWQALTP